MVRWGYSTARSAIDRVFRKCVSCFASHAKNAWPTSFHRVSSGAPPSQWNHGTIPLAVVCAIHIVVSSADFETWRHVGRLLLYAPVTLVIVLPRITACATRPCCAQSQIGVCTGSP